MLTVKFAQISPGIQHPVYWALTSLCGLNPRGVSNLANVSPVMVQRLAYGHDPAPEVLQRLLRVLESAVNTIAERDLEQSRWSDVKFARDYRLAFYAACNEIVKTYRALTTKPPRMTDLANEVLAVIGPGKKRSLAIAALRGLHAVASVRRTARRIGVVEKEIKGQVFWLPPKLLEQQRDIKHLPPPVPRPAPAKTPKTQRLYDLIFNLMFDMPDERACSRDVVDHCMRHGYTKAQVFRVARLMCLQKEVVGFGKEKRSYWSLPPAPKSDAPRPSGKVIPIDFRKPPTTDVETP